MPDFTDTIAAPATPGGTSALAVVRVSGPDTAALATTLLGDTPPPRTVRRADYRTTAGTLVDDVLLTFFPGPRSYTGEDLLEISCHGNPFIVQKILEDLLARGCRSAHAGEFTERAFLNGRMDLSQAEGVMDLIHARSERALAAANQQLRGSLGRRMDAMIAKLLSALARVEAYIDFPDEDLPPEDQSIVAREIDELIADAQRLLATSQYGEFLRDGFRVVLVGRPNVGKSSLLNRLVGKERALVSPEPGTTRDYIEERVMIGPHWIRLIDTAGLNPTPAALEKQGMERTLERADEADLQLVVLESASEFSEVVAELGQHLHAQEPVFLLNKSDLRTVKSPGEVDGNQVLPISALTGEGIPTLTSLIVERIDRHVIGQAGDEVIAVNARHATALSEAQASLSTARASLADGRPTELLASDLRSALNALGEIAGRVDNEKMLDSLFATFCIGK